MGGLLVHYWRLCRNPFIQALKRDDTNLNHQSMNQLTEVYSSNKQLSPKQQTQKETCYSQWKQATSQQHNLNQRTSYQSIIGGWCCVSGLLLYWFTANSQETLPIPRFSLVDMTRIPPKSSTKSNKPNTSVHFPTTLLSCVASNLDFPSKNESQLQISTEKFSHILYFMGIYGHPRPWNKVLISLNSGTMGFNNPLMLPPYFRGLGIVGVLRFSMLIGKRFLSPTWRIIPVSMWLGSPPFISAMYGHLEGVPQPYKKRGLIY